MMKFFVWTILFSLPLMAHARDNSPKAQFYRCYAQITQNFLRADHPLLAQVNAGSISPTEACMQVLEKASFTNGGKQIGNTNDQEALTVLKTMQRLHYSWFTQRFIKTPEQYRGERDLYDASQPAMYYTKALFDDGTKFQDVFLGKKNFEAIRMNGHGRGAFTLLGTGNFSWSGGSFLAPTGDLIGVEDKGYKCRTWTDGSKSGTGCLGAGGGGGVLGSSAYMITNLMEPFSYVSNGGTMVGRNWSKNVFQDFMCRTLPLVRESEVIDRIAADGTPLVNPDATIPFRTSPGCTKCHASMDRLASTVRNAYWGLRYPGGEGADKRVGYWVAFRNAKYPEIAWPIHNQGTGVISDVVDGEYGGKYWHREPKGVVFYSGYDGRLVNEPVDNLEKAAQVLVQQPELYICAAKRYFQYFTGVNVEIGDIGDPAYGKKLSEYESQLRNDVIQMGINMQTHQNPKQLIREVMNHPIYKMSDYGLNQ
jgi:hypothetical protein